MADNISRVLVTDGVSTKCGEYFEKNGITVTNAKLSKQQLLDQIQDYDALVVRSATKVTKEVLEKGSRLKVVGRAGTGVDNIDTTAATKRGIIVMNTPGGNTLSAVEHTCAMMLSLARHIPQTCADLKEGQWKKFLGTELYGKTLAIIGLGRIGREVAKRMKAFGMDIIGFDPVIQKSVVEEWGIKFLSLDDLWPRANYITVHTPLLPSTRGIVGRDALAKCPQGVRIINVARGGIVDESALLESLNSGHCGGAALDVFTEEPPTDLSLCSHPKVVCTPHLGANTQEAQLRVAVEIAEQIVDMSEGRPLVGVVNAPALTHALSESSRPWVHLSETLGYLANKLSKVVETPSVSVDVTLFGRPVSDMNKFLGSAVLVGLLRGMSPRGSINLVNAPIVAQEAGVTLQVVTAEGIHEETSLQQAVQISLRRAKELHILVGSVIGGRPTLFSVNGSIWEAGLTLGHNLLFFTASGSLPSPLPDIASALAAVSAPVTSLLSSAPAAACGTVWHVARSPSPVNLKEAPAQAQLVASVAF